jgi:hypothetical protein
MVTARDYLDILLPFDIKLKQDHNRNSQVYVKLTLASKRDVIFGIVNKARSKDFSRGVAG